MKPSERNTVILILAGVLALAGCVFLLYLGAKYVVTVIGSLEKELAAAIVAASGTILASVAAIIINQNRAKRREIEEAQRPNKIIAYKKFMELMTTILKKGKEEDFLKDGVLPPDLEEMFLCLQSDMIVWASPGVIKAYEEFKRDAQVADTSTQHKHVLLFWDDILQQIRKDLGHKNTGLKRGDLIKLFLQDPQELDRLTRA